MIAPYTRGAVLVTSASRRGAHVVDFEGDGQDAIVCTCESFILGGVRPCRHIREVNLILNI